MEMRQIILNIFQTQGGYAQTKDILKAGINHYYLAQLQKEGKIYKIKRGLYKLAEMDQDNEWFEVSKIVPEGVLCLFSAWAYHELSNFIPPTHYVAIEKSKSVSLPNYPPIHLHYWNKKQFELGILKKKYEGGYVKVYDAEKSVCDAIKFRNKVGKEAEKEVLNTYLKRSDRNIDKLMKYAEQLRVKSILKNYLEMII